MSDRVVFSWIAAISAALMGFLIWVIYLKESPGASSPAYDALPLLNSAFNTASALCVVGGYLSIRSGRRQAHVVFMSSALALSAAFLTSYLIYHSARGDTPFEGAGAIRPIYFSVLVSHVAATVVALPLILATVFFALARRFERHKSIARKTVPLWLYVSVTGVTVFVMLRAFG